MAEDQATYGNVVSVTHIETQVRHDLDSTRPAGLMNRHYFTTNYLKSRKRHACGLTGAATSLKIGALGQQSLHRNPIRKYERGLGNSWRDISL